MEDTIPRAEALRRALADARSSGPAAPDMLTVEETCQCLRISKWTLYRLIQNNKLKTVKIGSRRLIRVRAIVEFIDHLEKMVG